MAPAIAAPFLSHCSASVGAGMPAQPPGATVTGAPMRPEPDSVGGASSAGATGRTVRAKALAALPPEFVAVTVIRSSASTASAATVTRPVASSMTAPAPVTAKRRPSPEKSAAASTITGPRPASSTRSASAPAACGGARVTRRASVAASALPEGLVARTRQASSRPSSARTGV